MQEMALNKIQSFVKTQLKQKAQLIQEKSNNAKIILKGVKKIGVNFYILTVVHINDRDSDQQGYYLYARNSLAKDDAEKFKI